MKKYYLFMLPILQVNSFAQTPQMNSDIQINAKIEAGCFLTADNINFGILSMPITNTTAISAMNVKCSTGAPLSIDIYHGNVGESSNITSSRYTTGSHGATHDIYKNNVQIAFIACYDNGTIEFHKYTAGSLGNINPQLNQPFSDQYSICSGRNVNQDTLNSYGTPQNGSLKGLSNGETIKYNILVPNDNSKIWLNGINTYKTTGTGTDLSIPLKAEIKSSNNPIHRLSPDMYQDTLTVQLNY
jgi:spore coat protein U-like protein